MIRYAKHSSKNYIVIDSSFEINELKVPLHIQINVNELSENDRSIIYRTAAVAFNRHIVFNKNKPTSFKKPWWKIW
jgi:hypothetical protein